MIWEKHRPGFLEAVTIAYYSTSVGGIFVIMVDLANGGVSGNSYICLGLFGL